MVAAKSLTSLNLVNLIKSQVSLCEYGVGSILAVVAADDGDKNQ